MRFHIINEFNYDENQDALFSETFSGSQQKCMDIKCYLMDCITTNKCLIILLGFQTFKIGF